MVWRAADGLMTGGRGAAEQGDEGGADEQVQAGEGDAADGLMDEDRRTVHATLTPAGAEVFAAAGPSSPTQCSATFAGPSPPPRSGSSAGCSAGLVIRSASGRAEARQDGPVASRARRS